MHNVSRYTVILHIYSTDGTATTDYLDVVGIDVVRETRLSRRSE